MSLSSASVRPVPGRREDSGVVGNARLTASTGIILFLLLAAEGVTILSIRRLLLPHAFLGFVLIPPVLLKLGSTGYRFVRYYSGRPAYRLAGPPLLLLRLDAPIVVITTVVVLTSGVALWVFGLDRTWVVLHKGSFVIWFFATAVHVLGYLERAPRLALDDLRPSSVIAGAFTRRALLIGSLLAGLAVAIALISTWVTPFQFGFDR